MLAIIAAILFAVAFILHVTSTSTSIVFGPLSLVLVGLVLLALHLAGLGPAKYSYRR
jgi:tellurite resistance protein TehA-like permease